MKLTKKLEKEVMEVYEAYWDSYLNGDVAAISTLLDESYTQVGSAETEVFANKKDAVQFLHDTIDQVAGKLEMRNRSTRLEKQNNFLLFHELCDIYALAEPEWIFYSKFRATTIMEEKKDGWKIIHQHSSFPDARTDEGENIAIDKIAEENQLLREAIKRRTIELEYKNRELEIEASLERVRAQAMAMTKPDDTLSICEILFKEFQTLGFTEIRNSMINIHNDAQGTFVNYDFSEEIGKSINHLTYNIHPVIEKQIKQIRAANDAFSETIFTGEDLESWKEFRRNVGEKDDPRINNISELYYYFYSIGTGSIGISTFSSIDQEKLELLKRFRNVFNLSYQRYIDIALAEAQTREAQIELGLERVRARAMAMQKSDELAELVDTVFKELTKLDFALTWCMINIIDEPSLSNTVWTVNAETGKMPESFHMKFEDYPFHDAMMKGYQERKTKFIYVMEGIEKKVYDKYLFNETAFSKVPEEAQASSRAMEKYVCSFTFSNFGGLQTVGDEPLSDENLNILSRFGKVFDLTYTRFNDLKLAEAQSKEAQIELALERIRARTMAMQKSDELREAVLVIYEQLQHLNFEAQACNIIIIDKDTGDMQFWVSGFSQEIYPESYYIPRLNHHYHEDQLTAWREGVKYAVYEYSGKEKKSFDKIFFTQTDFKNVPENAKQFMIGLESVKLSTAFFSYGSLQVLGQEAISEEKVKILQRFTKVFEQTYTRFLDLKKAEAQARESQIEAALERVRAKAMTMHKTDDLSSAVATIFDELDKLNLGMLRCGIGILDKEKRSSDVWTTTISDQGKTVQVSGDESMDIHPLLQGAFNAWLHQKDFSYLLQGQDLNNYYKALLGVNFKLPDSQSKISEMHGLQQFYYVATFQAGGLFAFRETAFPDEAKIVIKRFADVFNFTYTRFQDLQQAEAQAREAQIELALERVRAKTMAMQRSDELGEAASLLFKQISDLGISTWTCGFHIWLEDDISSIAWMAKPDGSIQTPFRAPHTEDSYFKHIYEARQRGEDFFVMETAGEALEEKYHYLNNLPGVKKILNIGKTGFQIPKLQITHCAFFSNGYLMFITLESFPEAWDIFKRFAKIFEQTYT
ncbi:MAG: nuclear transport factor 2 family protein, partial [Ignavibacteriaceae bacterium]